MPGSLHTPVQRLRKSPSNDLHITYCTREMRRYELSPHSRRGSLIPIIIQTFVAFFVQVFEGGVRAASATTHIWWLVDPGQDPGNFV